MPYAPGVQYDARPLYEGLANAGRSIATAREAELQRQFLAHQLQQQQAYGYGIHADDLAREYYGMALQDQRARAGLDAQFGMHADTLAKDYYAIEQQNERAKEANTPFSPPSQALDAANSAGYYYLPQSRHGGSYVPRKTATTPPQIGTDPTGTGNFFYDGRALKQVRTPQGKITPDVSMTLGILDDQIAAKQKEAAQFAAMDPTKKTGFLGMFGPTAAEAAQKHALDIQELQARRTSLLGRAKLMTGGGDAATAPAPRNEPAPLTEPPLPVRTPAPAGDVPAYFDRSTPPGWGGANETGLFMPPPPTPRVTTSTSSPPMPDELPNLSAQFASAAEVKAAYKAGRIDKATATQALKQFGFQ